MSSNVEFYNAYLETTMAEVMELTKQKLASRAQTQQLEKLILQQQEKIAELQGLLDKQTQKSRKKEEKEEPSNSIF